MRSLFWILPTHPNLLRHPPSTLPPDTMGNAQGTTSNKSDKEILEAIEKEVRPFCTQRRMTGNISKVKQINPQKEEELLSGLKILKKTSSINNNNNIDMIHIPGWNDHEISKQQISPAKDALVRILLENDHAIVQERWTLQHEERNISIDQKKIIVTGGTGGTGGTTTGGATTTGATTTTTDAVQETSKQQKSSFLETLVECLLYESNLEMQLITANIIGHLCNTRYEETIADTQPLASDGGQSSKYYHPLTQLLRFRLGMLGAIPPLVLLTFQGQADLQLLGTKCLAGLASHPANRAAIASVLHAIFFLF